MTLKQAQSPVDLDLLIDLNRPTLGSARGTRVHARYIHERAVVGRPKFYFSVNGVVVKSPPVADYQPSAIVPRAGGVSSSASERTFSVNAGGMNANLLLMS